MLRRLSGVFRSALNLPKPMGVDATGNKYFEAPADEPGKPPRRIVKYKDDIDPSTIPVEWHSWLHGMRATAPTPEEIAQLTRNKEELARKGREWDAQDRKLRLQEIATREAASSTVTSTSPKHTGSSASSSSSPSSSSSSSSSGGTQMSAESWTPGGGAPS
eukprot:EC851929.1.p1 GENE.EC851929.1~~EC851929.1.p1  ORF type:complete len:161 (+),score=48.82 EC851929.1:28-510(+)